jgi:alpha-L-rhamnosidase
MKKCIVLLALCFVIRNALLAQVVNDTLMHRQWQASWIAHKHEDLKSYVVLHFRKNFELTSIPEHFSINVSADNRYKLYVNGKYISNGPARSDVMHWNFETIDIAPYLHTGTNLIAAVVWNFGEDMPWAQMSSKTGFIIQGNTPLTQTVNTNNTWKVYENKAYKPLPADNKKLQTFFVVGAGEIVDGREYPWNWEQTTFDDSAWKKATVLEKGMPYGVGSGAAWYLTPRTIPRMEESKQQFYSIRKITGTNASTFSEYFIREKGSQVIPPNQHITLLIDQGNETVAYPIINTNGGKDAIITLTYAEALIDANRKKGNRNEIEDKKIIGNQDIFILNGDENIVYTPLTFRTFRYVEMDITTKDDPLTLSSFTSIYTGYPFEEKASFVCEEDKSLSDVWKIGYRTARLCAGETYYDCPYYEQLQYTGDTRIQALISLYVTGDDRLMRKAIMDYDNSMISKGLTQSRYPSNIAQIIPTFSLFWVSMIHDYHMHRKDDAFIKSFMPNIDRVLSWYEQKLDAKNGMLGPLPWWCFVDWPPQWSWNNTLQMGGVPDGVINGNSSIISFQYVYTLRQAAALHNAYGDKLKANHYSKLADNIANSAYKLCYDNAKGLVADSPSKKEYSQHAGIMAVLANGVSEKDAQKLLINTMANSSITQATYYFKFYQTLALMKTGMADKYYSTLQPWKDMVNLGLTTFAEKPEPTRSDCHAWSASPNYFLLSTICGINPSAPGFSHVEIAPAMDQLNHIAGKMPHPYGMIEVDFTKKGNQIDAVISLPKNLSGTFKWRGKKVLLKSGMQNVKLF